MESQLARTHQGLQKTHGLAACRCLLCRVWLRVDNLCPLLRAPALHGPSMWTNRMRCPLLRAPALHGSSMRTNWMRCPLLRTPHSNPEMENPTCPLYQSCPTCSWTSPPTHPAPHDGPFPLSSQLLLRTVLYLICFSCLPRHDRTASCPEQTRGSEFHAPIDEVHTPHLRPLLRTPSNSTSSPRKISFPLYGSAPLVLARVM